MEYYLLLGVVCLLGGASLFFNKLYVRKYGSSVRSALWFTFLACGICVPVLLLAGQRFDFSWFSFVLALVFAVINVACTIFGFRTLAIGNVATYMLVLQLGGLVIPFVYGITLGGEGALWPKWVCMVLIIGALVVNMPKGEDKRSSRLALLYYGLLFTLNGLACVVISVNQKTPTPFGLRAVDGGAFTILYMLLTSALALIAFLVLRIKEGKPNPPVKYGWDILLSSAYGAFHGLGNLLIAICLNHVDASAQFPIVTGGSVVVAGLVGLFFCERITWRFVVASVLVMAGMLLLLPWETIFTPVT